MNVASSRAHSPGKAIRGWACPERTGTSRPTTPPPGTCSRARNAGPACPLGSRRPCAVGELQAEPLTLPVAPGYLRGKVRRIIRLSGAIAVRNLPAALGRGMLLGVLGASDGMGGAVPLRDGRNAVVALGWGAADSGMAFPFRGWMGSASSPAAAGRAAGTRRRRTATGAGANRCPSQRASAAGGRGPASQR